jgi:ABC-2 type transport system permease protein
MSPRSRATMMSDAARAEFLKLLTLPALYLAVLGTWTLTLAVDAALIAAAAQSPSGAGSALDGGLGAVGYAQAGFLVLGALAVTSEYQGGQIRTSLICVPRRAELLLVKGIVLALTCVPIAATTVIASVLLARLGPTTPAAVGPTAQAIGYLILTAVLASAVASLIRNALPTIAVLLGYYFVAGPLIRALAPGADHTTWGPDRPQTALAWTLVALTTAAIAFRHRDA